MVEPGVVGYLIQEGVRRSVAAREAGWTDIPAEIVEPGQPDIPTRLPLAELYSHKASIPRDYRYIRDVEYPTQVLGTEPPPIRVERLRDPKVVSRYTPLALVALT